MFGIRSLKGGNNSKRTKFKSNANIFCQI
jgi:hypothetical protein